MLRNPMLMMLPGALPMLRGLPTMRTTCSGLQKMPCGMGCGTWIEHGRHGRRGSASWRRRRRRSGRPRCVLKSQPASWRTRRGGRLRPTRQRQRPRMRSAGRSRRSPTPRGRRNGRGLLQSRPARTPKLLAIATPRSSAISPARLKRHTVGCKMLTRTLLLPMAASVSLSHGLRRPLHVPRRLPGTGMITTDTCKPSVTGRNRHGVHLLTFNGCSRSTTARWVTWKLHLLLMMRSATPSSTKSVVWWSRKSVSVSSVPHSRKRRGHSGMPTHSSSNTPGVPPLEGPGHLHQRWLRCRPTQPAFMELQPATSPPRNTTEHCWVCNQYPFTHRGALPSVHSQPSLLDMNQERAGGAAPRPILSCPPTPMYRRYLCPSDVCSSPPPPPPPP
eukprot:Sspe_Gene.32827::Locus_16073_Transcript_1_1_Confidence_1.000_Length_1774::g.32827::m.32827